MIIACFVILLAALFHLQAARGESYYNLAEKNRLRLIPFSAPRGDILDANGLVLAQDALSYQVCIIPQDIENLTQTLSSLSKILDEPIQRLKELYKKNISLPFVPANVAPGISIQTVLSIEEQRHRMPGVRIETTFKRFYHLADKMSHIIGFLGEIGKEELQEKKTYGYRYRDYIGKAGIEKTADAYLRGTPGGIQVEVNNLGQQVSVLGRKEPVPGKTITLTIDGRLQSYIAELMKDKIGAVVVIEPFTGEVLAMVSAPGFNPNKIGGSLNMPGSPHVNRTISGRYIPGSIFKLITAVCGLEHGEPLKNQYVLCNGRMEIGDSVFICWKQDGHGRVNLADAIIHSCNIFFYKLGLALGPEELNEWSRSFGLGRVTGIELPGESAGLVPSPRWKRAHLNHGSWFDGDTANFAIGQGYLLITPLQAACMVSAIANGGWFIQPHIIKKIQDRQIARFKRRYVGCSKETLDIIKNAMIEVVDNPSGTGFRAKVEGIKIAAKTGTAQTHISGYPHAWFVGFAPAEKPKISFCIFIEHGGSGGFIPADIAKDIVEFYLR